MRIFGTGISSVCNHWISSVCNHWVSGGLRSCCNSEIRIWYGFLPLSSRNVIGGISRISPRKGLIIVHRSTRFSPVLTMFCPRVHYTSQIPLDSNQGSGILSSKIGGLYQKCPHPALLIGAWMRFRRLTHTMLAHPPNSYLFLPSLLVPCAQYWSIYYSYYIPI